MSRNLCDGDRCYYGCGSVELTGHPHKATPEEVWGRLQYLGMIIANAECPECKAKYMAWIHWDTPGTDYWSNPSWQSYTVIQDLSFRSSFNDEPGDDDLPEFVFETVTYRVKVPAPNCPQCGKRKVHGYGCYCR